MKRIERKGFGVAVIAALSLPAVVLVGSMALSFQSSTARRFTSTVWMSYVGLELAEAAVAEASHFLKPADIFNEELFGGVARAQDPATELAKMMVADTLPRAIDQKAYREIQDLAGAPVAKMLVAFRVPQARPTWVQGRGLAKKLAAENRGILLDQPDDLKVYVRPLSFRREFISRNETWVNWGVVQFSVKVRCRELRGISTHTLLVDRRFSLRSNVPAGEEIVKVSSQNLRTTVTQEDR
jgi:hypothetical protein